MSRIFLAEDDLRLASLVKDYLERHNFTTQIEDNGLLVVEKIREFKPDLVLLDLMLPGKDGLEICKELRKEYDGPILMLTARDSDIDQVLGLEFGADDYVIKPAEPRVLLARVNALLRRCQTPLSSSTTHEINEYNFGLLTIKVLERVVYVNSSECELSSHEFDLLVILAQNAGKVLSRETLLDIVYHRSYDGLDRTIDVRVSQLRKKLGDSTENPKGIKTIWGKGYLFVADGWSSLNR